jgi:putative NIF3 family GTP cyclohydrolase 1 type 2
LLTDPDLRTSRKQSRITILTRHQVTTLYVITLTRSAWEVHALEPTPVPGTGQGKLKYSIVSHNSCLGRLVTLKEKTKLPIIVERIKKHLGLNHVRLAVKSSSQSPDDVEIETVALCAGCI